MILVTVGTHNQNFTRLVSHIDKLAPKLKDKVVIQLGHTQYKPKNCEYFDFSASLDKYYKEARLIIIHAGIGTMLEILKEYKKPLIAVPRQAKFNEHINDHQVGMAKYFEKKLGVKTVYNIKDLDLKTLKSYKKVIKYDNKNLKMLQSFLKNLIEDLKNKKS